jgi:hypothetical protein
MLHEPVILLSFDTLIVEVVEEMTFGRVAVEKVEGDEPHRIAEFYFLPSLRVRLQEQLAGFALEEDRFGNHL